jgi:hypothetical protein
MKRDIYQKLMNLQSSEADALLEKKFDTIDKTVRSASDNDVVYEQLELLEQFVFKVSDRALSLCRFLLERDPLATKQHRTKFGNYAGKSHGDVVGKVLYLLNQIRYYQTRDILPIYFSVFKNGGHKILEDKIRDIAQYNLSALQRIGYLPQLDIIDFLEKHKPKDDTYFRFFMALAQHLSSTEGESHEMKDENTLTLGFAPLPYHDSLKQVRSWLLSEAKRILHDKRTSLEDKLNVAELLGEMTHGGHRGEPSKELNDLLLQNSKEVVEIFQDLLKEDESIASSLPLAVTIEERLIFIERSAKDKTLQKSIDKLIAKLQGNYVYKIYRILVGARLDFFSRKNESFEAARLANDTQRNELIKEITSPDSPIVKVLFNVAEYLGKIESWKLNSYTGFVIELAKTKPEIAYQILLDAIQSKSAFSNLAGEFALGFRNAKATKFYSQTVELIASNKITDAIRLLALSLTVNNVSADDVVLAEKIFKNEKPFDFLAKEPRYNYIDFLTEVVIKVLPQKNKTYDALFIEMIKAHEQLRLGTLEIGTIRREAPASAINENVRKCIEHSLVTATDLSYKEQELLLWLYPDDANKIMDVFMQRISYLGTDRKLRRTLRYDAIPYHLEDNLRNAIVGSPDYADLFKSYLRAFDTKWNVKDSEIAELFRRLGNHKSALLEFVEMAKPDDLKRALLFCEGIEPIDLEVAFAIVKRTSSKKIWSSVRSRLYTTGMVEGEYGLANAHQRKYDLIKTRYADSQNARVKKFAAETLEWLEQVIKDERKRTHEELRLRKIEFEH